MSRSCSAAWARAFRARPRFCRHAPLSIAIGNFNGDSDPDIVVVNEHDNNVAVFTGGAGGSFAGPPTTPPGRPAGGCDCQLQRRLGPGPRGHQRGDQRRLDLLGGTARVLGPTTFRWGSAAAVAVGGLQRRLQPGPGIRQRALERRLGAPGRRRWYVRGPANYPVGSRPTSLAVGNFNGDSDPDLAVANELSHTISVLLGASDAGFRISGSTTPPARSPTPSRGASTPTRTRTSWSRTRAPTRSRCSSAARAEASPRPPTSPPATDLPRLRGRLQRRLGPDIAVANELVNSISTLVATPPETMITSGPAGLTNDATPTFTFSSADPTPPSAAASTRKLLRLRLALHHVGALGGLARRSRCARPTTSEDRPDARERLIHRRHDGSRALHPCSERTRLRRPTKTRPRQGQRRRRLDGSLYTTKDCSGAAVSRARRRPSRPGCR